MAHLSRLPSSCTGASPGRCDRPGIWLLALVVGLASTLLAAPIAAAPPSLEEAVKASYIFKFAPFIEWPAGAFAGPGAPFTICIAGQDQFGPLIDDVVRGQKIRGRAISLRRLNAAPSFAGCHILFIGRAATPGSPAPASVPGQPVLTITDAGSGTPAMIQFVMQGSRVRFQIDDAAARANGIVVSSKLLSLSLAAVKK